MQEGLGGTFGAQGYSGDPGPPAVIEGAASPTGARIGIQKQEQTK